MGSLATGFWKITKNPRNPRWFTKIHGIHVNRGETQILKTMESTRTGVKLRFWKIHGIHVSRGETQNRSSIAPAAFRITPELVLYLNRTGAKQKKVLWGDFSQGSPHYPVLYHHHRNHPTVRFRDAFDTSFRTFAFRSAHETFRTPLGSLSWCIWILLSTQKLTIKLT